MPLSAERVSPRRANVFERRVIPTYGGFRISWSRWSEKRGYTRRVETGEEREMILVSHGGRNNSVEKFEPIAARSERRAGRGEAENGERRRNSKTRPRARSRELSDTGRTMAR